MKRSHEYEKLTHKQKHSLLTFEEGYSSSRKLKDAHRSKDAVAITPLVFRDPEPVIELEKEIPVSATPPFFERPSTVATDSFLTRITSKLRTALNGFVLELQNKTLSTQPEAADLINNPIDDNCQKKSSFSNNDENITVKLALQNFIHSAKSQISELLSKQQKISNENSSSNIRPFNVDPLQIQISQNLQELLCNALGNRRFGNNAASSGDLVSETELQDLSHLLQDFLSSAKKKLSFSLNADSDKQPTFDTRSSTCIAESASDEKHLPQSIQNTFSQTNTSDKQQIQKHSNEQELKKRSILQHSNTDIVSDRVKNSSPSPSLIVKKTFLNKGSYKKIQDNTNNQYLSKKNILKSSISIGTSSQINKKQLFQPLSHYKSSRDKGSNKGCPKSKKLICRKRIQEDKSSISTTSSGIDKIQQSPPLNPNKTCHTKELQQFNSIPNPDLEIIERNSGADFHAKTMESYYGSDSSSRDGPNGSSYMNNGILLLSDCERTPDFLDLSLEVDDSDADEPVFEVQEFIHSGYADQESDSDEDVVVLGEKRPTYQEITLDEDDEGEVCEKVIELEKPTKIPKDLQDLLYDCPKCDKKFRVESLLKFHVRMHSVVESHGRVASPASFVATETETASDGDCISVVKDRRPRKSKSSQRHPRKEKENNKLSSKSSSHKHKNHREKHAKRKPKMSS